MMILMMIDTDDDDDDDDDDVTHRYHCFMVSEYIDDIFKLFGADKIASILENFRVAEVMIMMIVMTVSYTHLTLPTIYSV